MCLFIFPSDIKDLIAVKSGIHYIRRKGELSLAQIYQFDSFHVPCHPFCQIMQGDESEHYKKFLGLWNDADPGISEVEDTKRRPPR